MTKKSGLCRKTEKDNMGNEKWNEQAGWRWESVTCVEKMEGLKVLKFWLLRKDFKGYIREISYQIIALIKLQKNLHRKAAKNIPLNFTKLFKI